MKKKHFLFLIYISVCTFILVDMLVPHDVLATVGTYPTIEIYTEDRIHEIIRRLSTYVIATGVVLAILLVPYAGVLMATGNPDTIKNGKEMIYAILSGVLLLVLSGTLIRLVGTYMLAVE